MALDDDADNPRFVETLPRRGYRFIAPLDRPSSPQATPTPLKGKWSRLAKPSKPWAVGTIVLVLLAGIGVWRFGFRQKLASSTRVPRTVPLSSYSGDQCCPSFSPDGNQVAFVWTGPKQENVDIYLKVVGAEHAVRLTNDTADDFSPAWSPDGRYIAFLRVIGKRLGRARAQADGAYLAGTWGPRLGRKDSGTVFRGCFLVTRWQVAGSQRWWNKPCLGREWRKAQTNLRQPGVLTMRHPFLPTGQTLVFSRVFEAAVSELYLLMFSRNLEANGEPEQLTFLHYLSKDPVRTPDGHEILFSSGPLSSLDDLTAELWRMPVNFGKPVQPYFTGILGRTPTISQQRNRLAYMRNLTDVNIWRLELSGTQREAHKPISLISSTHFKHSPQYSPDGKRVVFCSTRSGTDEIWVASADGSDAVQLMSLGATIAGAPRWSPDGREVVFDSTVGGNWNAYTIDAGGGKPRRLTDHRLLTELPVIR